MTSNLSTFNELSVEELDQRLEAAVGDNERSERLVCYYLFAMHERSGYQRFGFRNVYDYAAERFGFSERKTRYLIHLAGKLRRLAKTTEALAEGRIGWTKALKIAAVAKPEDEALWLESAASLSVRELERRLRDAAQDRHTKLRFWLTEEQSAVWENALEVCRRVAGEDLSPERCLELIAGEFLATWAYEAHRQELASQSVEPDADVVDRTPPAGLSDQEKLPLEQAICPLNGDLPTPATAAATKAWLAVIERDGYRCTYPGCSARSTLHAHHIEYRSRSGRKSRESRDAPARQVTLCAFHHRMAHAGLIGVQGHAPDDLDWRLPEPMRSVQQERPHAEVPAQKTPRQSMTQAHRQTFAACPVGSPFGHQQDYRAASPDGVPLQHDSR